MPPPFVYPEVGLYCAQKEKGFYTPRQSQKEIAELYAKGLISKSEKDGFSKNIPDNDLRVYLPFKKEIEKIFKQYFCIFSVYEEPTKYYDSANWPIYVLKKK